MAKIVRTISDDASVVATAIDATDIVSEIEQIHKTSAVVTAALGRLTIAASLMGIGLKGEKDTLTLRMNGNGPTGALIAVADSRGNVKSYVCNPVVEIPLNKYGKLDVAGAVGKEGTLSVVKDLGLKEPYCGQIPIASGEIAEDITQYFVQSEQIPTACALGVLIDTDQSVRAAGGYLVQLMPGATDDMIDKIEAGIQKAGAVSKLLDEGMDGKGLLETVLSEFELEILEQTPVAYRCYCSRERVTRTLISLGKKELQDIVDEGKPIDIDCQFCDEIYHYTPEDIADILKEL